MNLDEFLEKSKKANKELIEVGLKLAEKLEGEDKAKVIGTIGNIYFDLGEFEEAEKFYLEALQMYIKIAEEDESKMKFVAACLQNLGNLYQVQKRFEEAEKAYNDALLVLEFTEAYEQKVQVLAALGTLYAKMGCYEKAEEVFKKALEINIDLRIKATILNNLIVVLKRVGKKDEALKLLDEVLKFENSREAMIAIQNLLDDLEILKPFEGRNLAIDAKIRYLEAKRSKGYEKCKLFLEAACLGFLSFRKLGFTPINFIYCLERASECDELKEVANNLKNLILKHYYGFSVEVKDFSSELEFVKEVLNLIKTETSRRYISET